MTLLDVGGWTAPSPEPLPAPGRDGVVAVLRWAADTGSEVPLPGPGGDTAARWDLLARAGAHDLVVARALEPHLDALTILAEAGLEPAPGGSYGVWAAEGPGTRLAATPAGGRRADGGWRLSGTKPWCSLAGEVTHGLVTAWVDDRRRGLFEVATDHPGLRIDAAGWSPLGLNEVVTATVHCDAVPARPVGDPGWYLERDGFAWGGIGVGAVWLGGAVGVARRLRDGAERRAPDQVALLHLGAVDAALTAAAATLREAARLVDAGEAAGSDGARLALRVRAVVARAAEEVLHSSGHALGPGPLAHEPAHAARVADLQLYLRQHHAERDDAALGRSLLDPPGPG